MKRAPKKIKDILEKARPSWDRPGQRDTARINFCKVCLCRTAALGAEVFASSSSEKVVYHTCKSRCCPSCGNRATILWQREQWTALPDAPFVGIILSIPAVFRAAFKNHRHLEHDLPALGAHAIE